MPTRLLPFPRKKRERTLILIRCSRKRQSSKHGWREVIRFPFKRFSYIRLRELQKNKEISTNERLFFENKKLLGKSVRTIRKDWVPLCIWGKHSHLQKAPSGHIQYTQLYEALHHIIYWKYISSPSHIDVQGRVLKGPGVMWNFGYYIQYQLYYIFGPKKSPEDLERGVN